MTPFPTLNWPGRRAWLIAVIVTTLATVVLLHRQVLAFSSVSDLGDPLFSMWRLGWIAHQLPHDPAHLFDGNIFYPATRSLAFSDSMLVPGLIAAPALWLGASLPSVYTSLVMLSFIAAGVAMFSLVRGVTDQTGPAVVAGLIFAFDPFRFAHYSHLELLFTCFMPLATLSLLRTLAFGARRDGMLTGLFIALQGLSSLYYGAYLTIALTIVGLAWVMVVGRPARGALGGLAFATIIAAIAGTLASLPYWATRAAVGERQPAEVLAFSATPRDYLSANDANPRYARAFPPAPNGERQLVPGAVPVALAAAALVPPAGPLLAIGSIGLVTSVDGSFGLRGLLYPTLYRWLPPMRAFRAPARFRAIAGMFLALLAGLGVARLLRWTADGWLQRATVATMAIAVLADLYPVLDLTELPEAAPPVYAWLATQPRGVVCDFPLGDLRGRIGPQDPTYEYYSTRHWMPLVNGYSGFVPDSYLELKKALHSFPDDHSLEALQDRGVDYLLVHSDFYVTGDYRDDVARLQRSPLLRRIGSFRWRDGGESTAFRVITPPRR